MGNVTRLKNHLYFISLLSVAWQKHWLTITMIQILLCFILRLFFFFFLLFHHSWIIHICVLVDVIYFHQTKNCKENVNLDQPIKVIGLSNTLDLSTRIHIRICIIQIEAFRNVWLLSKCYSYRTYMLLINRKKKRTSNTNNKNSFFLGNVEFR